MVALPHQRRIQIPEYPSWINWIAVQLRGPNVGTYVAVAVLKEAKSQQGGRSFIGAAGSGSFPDQSAGRIVDRLMAVAFSYRSRSHLVGAARMEVGIELVNILPIPFRAVRWLRIRQSRSQGLIYRRQEIEPRQICALMFVP
jgi:hypothetical protein